MITPLGRLHCPPHRDVTLLLNTCACGFQAICNNSTMFGMQDCYTVPCTALTRQALPAVRAVQGDCEMVYLVCQLELNMYPLLPRQALLHSPSLMAGGLSEGYETWPCSFVIGWSKYRLGNASFTMNFGPMWCMNLRHFSKATDCPLTRPLQQDSPVVSGVQGGYERV